MVDTNFNEVVWCYGEYQTLYDQIRSERKCPTPVRFHEGIPDMLSFKPSDGPRLLCIDDLMAESGSEVVNLFTKLSHHRNLSVIFITQNMFYKGKGMRDMSLNSHYVVVFKNLREKSQISHLARQICPENSLAVSQAFYDATKNPHSYILFDFRQDTPEDYRMRTNIFPSDEYEYVYIPLKRCRK